MGKYKTILLLLIALIVTQSQAVAEDISGCWSGHWVSCKNGHKGPLHATITKIDDTRYCARFSGKFWKLFPFRYSVILRVVEEGEVTRLRGSSYLGRLMGTFHYSATVSGCDFNATYCSKQDHGKWVMKRCGCCCN